MVTAMCSAVTAANLKTSDELVLGYTLTEGVDKEMNMLFTLILYSHRTFKLRDYFKLFTQNWANNV